MDRESVGEESLILDSILSSRWIPNRDRALQNIANPGDWSCTSSFGDWRGYVPMEVRIVWNRLPLEAKAAVYATAVRIMRLGD